MTIAQAVRWFDLARKSPDPEIAAEAERAWRNLRPETQRFRVTAWAMPSYSSRWRDTFSYGQVKAEWNLHWLVRPYLSARGDRRYAQPRRPGQPAVFFRKRRHRGRRGWPPVPGTARCCGARPAPAIGYLSHHATPDYRGGLSFARSRGRNWFARDHRRRAVPEPLSERGLLYSQNRAGYSADARAPGVSVLLERNVTVDAQAAILGQLRRDRARDPDSQHAAGISRDLDRVPARRLHVNENNPRRPNFYDLRIGLWYALSH